ncbi:hypothetical protein [Brevibacillus choshinensis]|uniref:hypothetical protein n=1 Tax=Brevibacillus choshinensis TaxID=54911 RepID=UPI002E1A72A1|nr:hypothetical protein [Brevibacillus choshinensis]MED4753271.1 hypothetical protein [Brevibacillus choshinensis]MED4782303.1 hypothetical protein [Brevibacillus choshinensis]
MSIVTMDPSGLNSTSPGPVLAPSKFPGVVTKGALVSCMRVVSPNQLIPSAELAVLIMRNMAGIPASTVVNVLSQYHIL